MPKSGRTGPLEAGLGSPDLFAFSVSETSKLIFRAMISSFPMPV